MAGAFSLESLTYRASNSLRKRASARTQSIRIAPGERFIRCATASCERPFEIPQDQHLAVIGRQPFENSRQPHALLLAGRLLARRRLIGRQHIGQCAGRCGKRSFERHFARTSRAIALPDNAAPDARSRGRESRGAKRAIRPSDFRETSADRDRPPTAFAARCRRRRTSPESACRSATAPRAAANRDSWSSAGGLEFRFRLSLAKGVLSRS